MAETTMGGHGAAAETSGWAAQAVTLWALIGVLALLSQAMVRLTPLALEALRSDLTTVQWAVLVPWVLWMLYGEGFKGFQRGYSPRVVARAFHVGRHGTLLHKVVAPIYAMTLFHAHRRQLRVSWGVLLVIVALIVAVRLLLVQPWRGIIDAGVVAGLAWGAASILALYVKELLAPGSIPLEKAALPDDEAARLAG